MAEDKRGSLWHRWDAHIHTPDTALNDHQRARCLDGTQKCSPRIWTGVLRALLGITDYFGIERDEQVIDEKRHGRLPGVV